MISACARRASQAIVVGATSTARSQRDVTTGDASSPPCAEASSAGRGRSAATDISVNCSDIQTVYSVREPSAAILRWNYVRFLCLSAVFPQFGYGFCVWISCGCDLRASNCFRSTVKLLRVFQLASKLPSTEWNLALQHGTIFKSGFVV